MRREREEKKKKPERKKEKLYKEAGKEVMSRL